MIPTLQIFLRALLTPDLSFATLGDARPVAGSDPLPRLMRTTRFAETEIEWRGERWLLSMPLTAAAAASVERTASQLARLNTDFLAEYRLLPGELRWRDDRDQAQSCDLTLQRLPEGRSFEEALLTQPAERLLAGLDALRAALRELGFAHNNLRSDNLRWTGDRFVPLRYHDARFGCPSRDDAAFESLRQEILLRADPMRVSDTVADYAPSGRLTGHLRVHHNFEGLICVEDAAGYGFVDANNTPVIPAQFLWAGDFHEGRAEVQTRTGMGLIDREGGYVIPPEYEIVDYLPAESVVRVRKNGLWAEFDYLGRPLTDFGMINEG